MMKYNAIAVNLEAIYFTLFNLTVNEQTIFTDPFVLKKESLRFAPN